jgi:solute carrier family 35 (adenosine 3'-phospho 5'-phosphosulfate transporter), member B3
MLPTHKNEVKESNLKILCFTIENLSPKSEFLICCGLVFVYYLIYGYIAELIFTLDGVSGWFITLIQFFFYAVFGIIENGGKTRNVPMKIYSLLAFLTLGTMVRLK